MPDLFESAAKSATYNIILQVFMRIITFIINAFILRFVSEDVLGVINVRLLLLYTTVQFLSREAFRRSCLSKVRDVELWQVVNLLWMIIPVCCICGSLMSYVWLFVLVPPSLDITSDYRIGVLAVVSAVLIEALSEPVYVVSQTLLFVKLKVFAEGLMLLTRAIVMASLVRSYPSTAVVDFSISLVVSSTVYTSIYYVYFVYRIVKVESSFTSIRQIFPSLRRDKPFVDARMLLLTFSFLKQGLLKQLLTEGERYVMTLFGILSFAEQGIYDVVNNLGSLAARFVFAPIEESSYLFFSQMIPRGIPAQSQTNEKDVNFSARVLENLLKMMTLLGVVVVTFGYSYSPLLLHVYGGCRLSSGIGPTLLRYHCVYVILLAINGVSEAFVFASMSQKDVDRYNHKMIIFAIIFVLLSLWLTSWFGSVGFILANCGNMALRICHSLWFIRRHYVRTSLSPLKGMRLSPFVAVALVLSFTTVTCSKEYLFADLSLKSSLFHVIIGLFCLVGVFISVLFYERDFIDFIFNIWKKKREKSE